MAIPSSHALSTAVCLSVVPSIEINTMMRILRWSKAISTSKSMVATTTPGTQLSMHHYHDEGNSTHRFTMMLLRTKRVYPAWGVRNALNADGKAIDGFCVFHPQCR